MISEFSTFRPDSFQFIELCVKLDLKISYNRWKRPTLNILLLMMSCELTSGSVFGHVGTYVPDFMQIYSCSTDILACYEIQYGCRPPSWICWGKLWDNLP